MVGSSMVGQMIDNYKVIRQLGAGGMGVVYVAQDMRLEREVALKVIYQSNYSDAQQKQRFLREARAIAALDHPNIGTLFDIKETNDGQMVMVMARYRGETLAERLERDKRLSTDDALRIALQIVQGLEHAHRAGVVHRDIKPANLFLTREGLVKILDFGTAKLLDSSRTFEDSASGTLAYMSPEQLEGRSVGVVADVWAWGVVLFEMLTGFSPFHRVEGSARLFAALHEAPDRLEPHLSPGPRHAQLQTVLDRTLTRDTNTRYHSAAQLIAALTPLLGTGTLNSPSRESVPHNLPARRKPLWGRDAELARLAKLLPDPSTSLVTLLGQGGIGKSHLALHAATAQRDQGMFAGGVYFVELESLGGTSNVPAAIAEAVGLELTRQDAWDEIYAALANRAVLLVLDNLEHLPALPGYLDTLLEKAPNLTLLTTSRERLNLAQEQVVELRGLESPSHADDDFSTFAASQLFIQAALKQDPDFSVDDADRDCTVSLCRKLDGWPLGLELAAVWVRQLSCCDIVAEIERNLDILSTRARNVSARQRSARAVLEYSWERLSEAEQRIMRQLAVFYGGFDRDAAEKVVGSSLIDLATLIDKSLLRTDTTGRYQRHPIVQQFCSDKLAKHPDEERQTRDRHAAYYAAYIQNFKDDLRSANQREALIHLEEELENLRLAWLWLAERGDYETLYDITNPLYNFYNYRGCYSEGLSLFKEAFERLAVERAPSGESVSTGLVRGTMLSSQAWLLFRTKAYSEARTLATQSLALLEGLEPPPRADIANVLTLLGGVADNQNEKADAQRYYQKALERFKAVGDDYGIAAVLHNLATVLSDSGDSDAAIDHYQQSLRRYHSLGHQVGVAYNLYSIGMLYFRDRDYSNARSSLEQALAISEETGFDGLVPTILQTLGRVAMDQDDPRRAAKHLRRALSLSSSLGDDGSYTSILVSLGELSLRRGRQHEARDYLQQGLERLHHKSIGSTLLRCLCAVAELWHVEQRDDDARALLQRVIDHPQTATDTREQADALLATLTPPLAPVPQPSQQDLKQYARDILISLATAF